MDLENLFANIVTITRHFCHFKVCKPFLSLQTCKVYIDVMEITSREETLGFLITGCLAIVNQLRRSDSIYEKIEFENLIKIVLDKCLNAAKFPRKFDGCNGKVLFLRHTS